MGWGGVGWVVQRTAVLAAGIKLIEPQNLHSTISVFGFARDCKVVGPTEKSSQSKTTSAPNK